MDKKQLQKEMLADLKRSGLTASDAKLMKLQTCDEDQASVILCSTFAVAGYAIPYFNINGKISDAVRFKFLEELLNEKKNVVKYSQPKGSAPRLYFPPNMDWKKVLKDASITLNLTEGEKKAFAACKAGIPTIALSGVNAYRSKKLQKKLIDDFKNIVLKGRKVLICFDNDMHTNEDVLRAARGLARELNAEGAEVYNKVLPFSPYDKIGLDDYLLDHTKKDYLNLPEEKFSELYELESLNDEVAYIRKLGRFYLIKDDLIVNSSDLVKSKFANRTILLEGKPVSIAQQWIAWPNRREHNCITYKPGQPQITAANEFNLWKGSGLVAKKGNITPFMKAVNQLFNNDKPVIKWFLDWIAYPIQNPGTKMFGAVLIQSIEQGTGKSSIGMCIGSMYGENGTNWKIVDDDQLNSTHNEWAVCKQFILGDEISGKDKRGQSDRIKLIVTRPSVNINRKYEKQYDVPDCINYLITSNHTDPLNLEQDDRRWLVIRLRYAAGLSVAQGKALEHYHLGEKPKGAPHLLHYFLYEHTILKDFDHRARPPMTDAKAELIEHSFTDIERWLSHVKENPTTALVIDGVPIDRDLYTVRQMISLYERTHPKANVTDTAMGKAVNKIFHEMESRTIRTSNGVVRVKALNNIDKWRDASHAKLRDHFERSKIALFQASKHRKYSK